MPVSDETYSSYFLGPPFLVLSGQKTRSVFERYHIIGHGDLREAARNELGDAFDIRAFHDAVLGRGAVTLEVLESQIKDWIASRKGETL